jgi:hypothetical protein
MMLVICTSITCKTVTRLFAGSANELVSLVGEKSEWWPGGYRCPNCEKQASGVYEGRIDPNELKDFNVRELEAQDYFRFMMGVGLPEEQDCQLSVLIDTFKAGKVAKIAGHEIRGSKRYCVEWLEMEDGTRLYFGASSHGATVYRITKKMNFTEKALEDAG